MKYLLLLLLTAFSFNLFANNYRVNEEQVNTMIQSAKEVPLHISEINKSHDFYSHASYNSEYKDPVLAFILCWFVGYLGIHRLYLGTSPETLIAYIVTCGGCGIVVAIDWIVLLIEGILNENVEYYVDNPKFFMW